MKIEPIYQLQSVDGCWIDQAKHSYDYNVKHGSAVVRVVYTEAQLRQLGEACAAIADDYEIEASRCAIEIRELIKELLPTAELAKQEKSL